MFPMRLDRIKGSRIRVQVIIKRKKEKKMGLITTQASLYHQNCQINSTYSFHLHKKEGHLPQNPETENIFC